MISGIILYSITAALLFIVLLSSTSIGFVFIDTKTKAISIVVEVLASIFWLPALLYLSVWTIVKRIKGENLSEQN